MVARLLPAFVAGLLVAVEVGEGSSCRFLQSVEIVGPPLHE